MKNVWLEKSAQLWSEKYKRPISTVEADVISRNLIALLEIITEFNLTKKGGKDESEKRS